MKPRQLGLNGLDAAQGAVVAARGAVGAVVELICRVHHEKCWTGRSTSWNQDCWEKYRYRDLGVAFQAPPGSQASSRRGP